MNIKADQSKLRGLQNRIRARKGLIGCGDEFSAALHISGKLVYAGSDRWGQEESRFWTGVQSFACGRNGVVALTADGMLRLAGQCPVGEDDVRALSGVRSVSVSDTHVAALLGSGITVALGDNRYGQCNTKNWSTVADIVCGRYFTAGVSRRGQIYIVGGSRYLRYKVRTWKNIAGVFTDYEGTTLYAITADGRLLSSARLPLKASKWRNLVCVSAYGNAIWGVTAGGRLLSTEGNLKLMSDKKQYVACAVSAEHVIALTRDGQIIAVGNNQFGQSNAVRFGTLFSDFDEMIEYRRQGKLRMTEQEHRYQSRLTDAERYRSRMACGKHLMACINAEGRVLTTAELPESKAWSRVRAVACGNAHVLALHENGTVSAGGNNLDGCADVAHWKGIKTIAAGKYHSLGLTEDGRVLFAGRNERGQGNLTDWKHIRRVAAADRYTVGVTYDGQIRLAGATPFVPSVVDDAWRSPVAVVAASSHLACLYADSTVKTTSSRMKTEDWYGTRAIAAGTNLTLGLCYGGRVLATVADGKGEDELCRRISAWRNVVDIGCGDGYAAGLTADGRVLVAQDGSLPHITDAERWQGILAIQCGPRHLVALSETGQILSWSEEADCLGATAAHFVLFRDVRQLYGYGQYSRRLEQEIQSLQPESIPAEDENAGRFEGFSAVEVARFVRGRFAIGMAHTILLDANGNVKLEGANDCGQCDLAAYDRSVYVAAGPYRSAAILADGCIVMAGRNSDGQGDAESLNREAAETIPYAEWQREYPSGWLQISCGHSHTVALRADGRVFAVGADPDGRCETSEWRDITDVCCGVRHTVGRRADGTCVAVGDNRYGQCDTHTWRDVVAVTAGEFHTVALCSDGRLLAVGDNRKGQCDLGDIADAVAVACLPEATLCVLSDGRAVLRGGSGELNTAVEALRDVIGVSTCEHRIAAMTADGSLVVLPLNAL